MRTAVITDIHANIDALDAVLADCDSAGATEVIALGDLVGYGHDPEAVIQRLMERKISSVMGNHEMALLEDSYLASFNGEAAKAIRLHREWLSKASMDYIQSLPRVIVRHGARFVHGLPPDSVIHYVSRTPEKRVSRIMELLKERISFTGHTHLMSWFERHPPGLEDRSHGVPDDEIEGLKRGAFQPEHLSPLQLDGMCRYLISAGSVGQPRDGVWHAKYVIWDRETRCIEPRYVVYDNRQAARKIEKRGLPKRFSSKLL
jgi:predicted phosphodiesterase